MDRQTPDSAPPTGKYRARRITRARAIFNLSAVVALIVVLVTFADAPRSLALEWNVPAALVWAFFGVVCILVAWASIWKLTERVEVREDTIDYSVLGRAIRLGYDEVTYLVQSKGFPGFPSTRSTIVGNSGGRRIMLAGYIEKYGEIARYLSARTAEPRRRPAPLPAFVKILAWFAAAILLLAVLGLLFALDVL